MDVNNKRLKMLKKSASQIFYEENTLDMFVQVKGYTQCILVSNSEWHDFSLGTFNECVQPHSVQNLHICFDVHMYNELKSNKMKCLCLNI